MKRRGLVIGINTYPTHGLNGCANDATRMAEILRRIGIDKPTKLIDKDATRANILAALAELRGTPSDEGVFVFYAGHGVRVIEGKRRERTAREALVPHDGDDDPAKLLFDHELNAELAAIAATTKNLTLILDCCCSAGVFRAAPGRIRAIPAIELPEGSVKATPGASLGAVDDWAVVAACRADQRANESADDAGKVHGELSRSLLDLLDASEGASLASLRWDQVWWDIDRAVRARSPQQFPQIFSGWRRSVFGGPPSNGDVGLRVERTADGSYAIDAGTLAGIGVGADIALEPPGIVRVEHVDRSSARGRLTTAAPGPARARGRLASAVGIDRVRVRFANLEALPSPLVQAVDDAPDFIVTRTESGYRFDDDLDRAALALAPYFEFASPADAPEVASAVLEHAVAHHAPLRWAQRANDLRDAIRIRLREVRDGTIVDIPRTEHGVLTATFGRGYVFVVENSSAIELDVALVDCGSSGTVTILGRERVPALGRHTFWRASVIGQPFFPNGAARSVDRLVALASSDIALVGSLARASSFEDVLARERAAVRGAPNVVRETRGPIEQWASDHAVLLLAPAARGTS